MSRLLRKIVHYPVFALGGTVLWGLIEIVALQRAGFAAKKRRA